MSFEFSTRREGALLLVVFEGEITPEEEQQALEEVGQLPGLRPDADVLVDRRAARMTVGPQHVGSQIELAQSKFPVEGKPRMAQVVSSDLDFGMLRMLELRGTEALPHELRVFRSWEEACAWLDVDPDEVGPR